MKTILAPLLVLLFARLGSAQPIQDNSFLLEEAYNQEQGVVQHISAFERLRGGNWLHTFTQEWPVTGQRHQLSFTLPVQHVDRHRGLGDIAVNYRYQLVGDGDAALAISPRISMLLPTGDEERGLGAGSAGVQLNLPASAVFHPRLVTHWNAGATLIPEARDAASLGGSFIWLAHPRFNVMFETAWTRSLESSLFINPGMRWAHNCKSGLQIVPGIAFPVGIGSSAGERGIFLYLSFEHPFGSFE